MQETSTVALEAAGLQARIFALEAERECRELLARYGFYADFGLSDEWVDLFTEDGVMEFSYFDDSEYMDDQLRPRPVDPATLNFPLKTSRFAGRDQLHACITAPRHERLEGRCQHHADGQPTIFKLVDEHTAVIVSNTIIYGRSLGNFAPAVQYQNHSLNRWTFRRTDAGWRIAENIRFPMGSEAGVTLLSGI
jgi:hypothetical protein